MNATPPFDPDGPAVRTLRADVTNSWKLAAFMASKLPMGLIAGLRIRDLTADRCVTTVRYGWLTTNPFKSTYFAVLAMGAEMASGALGLSLVRAAPVPVSILIVGMNADFVKKATDTTTFVCEDGANIREAVVAAVRQGPGGEGTTVVTRVVGTNQAGEVVARFSFTWSFRVKSTRPSP